MSKTSVSAGPKMPPFPPTCLLTSPHCSLLCHLILCSIFPMMFPADQSNLEARWFKLLTFGAVENTLENPLCEHICNTFTAAVLSVSNAGEVQWVGRTCRTAGSYHSLNEPTVRWSSHPLGADMSKPGSLPENISTAEKTIWMAQLSWHLSWQALRASSQPNASTIR